jgi:hypothetical protein
MRRPTYFLGMRSAIAALGLGTTLTLAGLASCSSPPGPIEMPGPDPSSTPVFASDAEALAAAEDAFGAYIEASNRLGQSGWLETDELIEAMRGDALQAELDLATDYAAKRWKQVGDTTYDSMTLQQIRDNGSGPTLITVYVCADVSSVDVLDASGDSVVGSDRRDRQPFEADVDNQDGKFKVSRSEAWSGTSFC